ncbi:hypothetical protein [Phytohabitans aurantiacus]|uniref:Integral membrane protein n=1 Tax=Phytohabitans aurantiacus TaxID=3016789 RepID=A0ABQ5QZB7_9ACTN|nr:hypothetical protein [Phytohabitans aurantiacus]GLH99898.1 hypothetical protein Pa4123_51740 [Phytohabitans aurantiacus]
MRRRSTALRWTTLLTGGAAAVGMVAVAIFANQAYTDGRLRWMWLAGALATAAAAVWVDAIRQRVPSRAVLAVTDSRGRPRLMHEATLAELGVHPNRFDTDDGPAPYLPRDDDAKIIAAVESLSVGVIVHGARLAGASRSLAHHARRLLPDHLLLIYRPDPDVTIAQLVAHAAGQPRGAAARWRAAVARRSRSRPGGPAGRRRAEILAAWAAHLRHRRDHAGHRHPGPGPRRRGAKKSRHSDSPRADVGV